VALLEGDDLEAAFEFLRRHIDDAADEIVEALALT
jgi:hypothetical protein